MSDGVVLVETGAENIKSYLEKVQQSVRDNASSAVSILTVRMNIQRLFRSISSTTIS